MCVRGSWRPNRTATYWPPLLWPSALCLSRSPGLLTRRLEGPDTCWVLFSLPHLVSNSSDLQLTDFLSPPSYIIVQSPTQSLEWHVWSSSSGKNCHAVHRSLSSGASVYECTMGFYLVPYYQQSPPMRFFLITAIGMCHFLPGHHFGMACLAGSKVNIHYYLFLVTDWRCSSDCPQVDLLRIWRSKHSYFQTPTYTHTYTFLRICIPMTNPQPYTCARTHSHTGSHIELSPYIVSHGKLMI